MWIDAIVFSVVTIAFFVVLARWAPAVVLGYERGSCGIGLLSRASSFALAFSSFSFAFALALAFAFAFTAWCSPSLLRSLLHQFSVVIFAVAIRTLSVSVVLDAKVSLFACFDCC